MNEQLSLRRYRRDCLLGMLGGMLMLANAVRIRDKERELAGVQ